ncbi:hypothetical protein Fmac_012440 [Flemingia macrophylla]|uniref:Uncharacterized protein n=1 Tax=Flemingia macrophylla TaxID=520843 RepID=A0ABD1MQA2_9FABA
MLRGHKIFSFFFLPASPSSSLVFFFPHPPALPSSSFLPLLLPYPPVPFLPWLHCAHAYFFPWPPPRLFPPPSVFQVSLLQDITSPYAEKMSQESATATFSTPSPSDVEVQDPTRYKNFLLVDIVSVDFDDLHSWKGWVESSIRRLTLMVKLCFLVSRWMILVHVLRLSVTVMGSCCAIVIIVSLWIFQGTVRIVLSLWVCRGSRESLFKKANNLIYDGQSRRPTI